MFQRVYDLERRRLQASRDEQRQAAGGTGERSDKVRTYNFPQVIFSLSILITPCLNQSWAGSGERPSGGGYGGGGGPLYVGGEPG